MKANIMVVEDQFLIAEDLSRSLKKLGYNVVAVCQSAAEAVEQAGKLQPDITLMDIRLKGDVDGIQAAAILKERFNIPVVFLTAHSDEATLERAGDVEPLGYLLKPFEERQLYTTLEMALNQRRIVKAKFIEQNRAIVRSGAAPADARAESPRAKPEFANIIGSHPLMMKLLESVDLVAKTDVTVHIYGENGTGKELIADALHNLSGRKNARFIKINCSAIPGTLLESALFGHAKGSFTGAMKEHEGFVEHAEGGTLFLDEVGDISHDIQVKLLRLLQAREYCKVGESKVRKSDIRIITATNRKLKELVAAGKIREDFYYRVNVFPLIVPSLRERRSDVMEIADHFRVIFNKIFSKELSGYTEEAKTALTAYDWPGNVRELENAIKYAFVVTQGGEIGIEQLPAELREHRPGRKALTPAPALEDSDQDADEKDISMEKDVIMEALRKTGGNKAQAAKLLGYSRVTLWKKLGKLGVDTSGDN